MPPHLACLCARALVVWLARELLANVDYVAPNETELQRLVNLPTSTEAEVAAAAAALQRDAGVPFVLVTVGAGGSVLFGVASEPTSAPSGGGGAPLRQPCFPAPCVVDTTGAGDCFRGAFAAALAGDRGLVVGSPKAGPKEALEVGAAAAAHCVTVSAEHPFIVLCGRNGLRAAHVFFLRSHEWFLSCTRMSQSPGITTGAWRDGVHADAGASRSRAERRPPRGCLKP